MVKVSRVAGAYGRCEVVKIVLTRLRIRKHNKGSVFTIILSRYFWTPPRFVKLIRDRVKNGEYFATSPYRPSCCLFRTASVITGEVTKLIHIRLPYTWPDNRLSAPDTKDAAVSHQTSTARENRGTQLLIDSAANRGGGLRGAGAAIREHLLRVLMDAAAAAPGDNGGNL